MQKKLLAWILTFAISIIISAIFNLSNQGVVFLVLYLLEFVAVFFFAIGYLFSQDFPDFPLAVVISFLLVAVSAGVGLIVAWIISLFSVNFYVAYEISTFVLCFIPAKVTVYFKRS